MKHILTTLIVAAATTFTATAAIDAVWSFGIKDIAGYDEPQKVLTITASGDLAGIDRLCFNSFKRPMTPAVASDTIVELFTGYYAIDSERLRSASDGDTVAIDIVMRHVPINICYGPDGMHTVDRDGGMRPVALRSFDAAADPTAWGHKGMPTAEEAYAFNESLSAARRTKGGEAGVHAVVPSYKSVRLTGGNTTVDPTRPVFKLAPADFRDGEYRMVIADGAIAVECAPRQRAAIAHRLRHNYGDKPVALPAAVITDYPSSEYRAVMIDIARNYQTPEEMHRIVDLLADYGLNTLHFHFSDDEAWRLEMQSLPELTGVAARRGYTTDIHGDFLPQIFAGNGSTEATDGTANGFFTRQDFISFLHHADSLGIVVIPEVESPGHARAAANAMAARARHTGDHSYIMQEVGDTSRYVSAQNYVDNVMNPGLEGTFKFMDTVADELIDIYAEAGVPLTAIHIGGDEVPRHCWDGSDAVRRLMEREGLTSTKEVQSYFTRRVVDSYRKKGIPVLGWQEVALGNTPEVDRHIIPAIYGTNMWNTLSRDGATVTVDRAAAKGYPVILSNVDKLYFDMVYNLHPDERGLNWGGTTNEFDALAAYPDSMCTVEGAVIRGLSGQVWSETIRSAADLERMLLPKMVGLGERAWNSAPTYTDADFHAVVLGQMPRWRDRGLAYHLHMPGIKAGSVPGTVTFNSAYPEATIHYTTDGSRPTAASPVAAPGTDIAIPAGTAAVRAIVTDGHATSTPSLHKL